MKSYTLINLVFLYIIVNDCHSQHTIKKLPALVNTDYLDEICPIVSYDKQFLFFTRTADYDCNKTLIIDGKNMYATSSEKDFSEILKSVYSQIASEYVSEPLNSAFNQDIWYSRLKEGEPKGIYHPPYPINDVLPNSICSNYGTSNGYLVINQFLPKGGIENGFSLTQFDGNSFSFPQPIHIEGFSQVSSEVNITSSKDSTILILSMQNEVTQSPDLYISHRIATGHYSAPIHMGQTINSEYRESTPMLSHNMQKLYFTSDRPEGLGGTDIYVTERTDATFTQWSTPKRLDPPLNSEFNDSHPHLMNDDNTILFTSNRDGTSDIFQAKLKRTKIKTPIVVNIQVIHKATGVNHPAEIVWGDAYKNHKSSRYQSKTGICKYKFFQNKPIAFQAFNGQMQSDEIIIDPQYLVEDGKTEVNLELFLSEQSKLVIKRTDNPVIPETGNIKTISMADKNSNEYSAQHPDPSKDVLTISENTILHSIYFERTKAVLLKESYSDVQKLYNLLKDNPKMNISIAGHTDNVGEKASLIKLSHQRAVAIKKILIEKGISPQRVTALGYGDTKPLAPNDTEENKSKNRRVEIKIVGI